MPDQAAIDSLHAILAAALSPPAEPQPFAAWCGRLLLAEGPAKGQRWQWPDHPAQASIVRALAARERRRFAICGPTQDGKTLAAVLAPLLYGLAERRQPAVWGLPDLLLAGKLWRDKLLPAIRGAGLGALLPESGPGSGGGAPTDVLIGAARLFFLGAGARNESGQAGVTAPLIVIDELDSIDPYRAQLLERRGDAYGDEATVIASSTVKGVHLPSPILSAWESGTQGQPLLPCPSCGTWVDLTWPCIHYDDADELTAAASARWACPSCGTLHSDDQRLQALAQARIVHRGQRVEDGIVRGPLPGVATWSIRWTALHSPLRRLGLLAQQHLLATRAYRDQGRHELLRSFHLDQLVELPPTLDGEAVLSELALASRSALPQAIPRGNVPESARISIGIDVQKREAWWLALATWPDGSGAIIDYGVLPWCDARTEPTPEQQRAGLQRLADRLQRLGRADWVGIDAGYVPEIVVPHALRQRWQPLKGDQRPHGQRTSALPVGQLIELRRQTDARPPYTLAYVDGAEAKAELHRALQREPGAPGSIMPPADTAADDWLCRQLCAERYDPLRRAWVKVRRDNHLLDCGAYALAGSRLLAARAPSAPPPTDQPRPYLSQPGRGWMDGYA